MLLFCTLTYIKFNPERIFEYRIDKKNNKIILDKKFLIKNFLYINTMKKNILNFNKHSFE